MKVSATILAATAATAAIGVAQAADIKPLILGGTVVPAGTKTYQVGLRQLPDSPAFCGGTLISPTHVLTAAHCAGFVEYVSIGSHFLEGDADGERIAVKKETPHPLYDDPTTAYDYNIIELASPSSFPPVQLLSADSETFVGAKATTMGWGTTRRGGEQSPELLRVDVAVVSNAVCSKLPFSDNATVTETMFCAGGEINKDSCQGDSGGPLILEQPTGDVQIGVVSWGEGCGLAGFPGVYAKVSFVKDWILSIAPTAVFV